MDIPLDEVIHFDCITSHPTTGAATDADSTPTFAVYEEATDTDIGVGGNLTKRTSLTGNYRGTFTASSANGFEVGKWYNVIASATVNSIAGKAVVKAFRIVAAENTAGYPVATIKSGTGTGEVSLSSGAVIIQSGTGTGQIKLSSGYVAPNWGDVGNPTTTVNLSGTTISTSQAIASVSGAVGSVTAITTSGGSVSVYDFTTAAKALLQAEAEDALAAVGVTTTVTGRIDAAVSSRMATYVQPTGFLAATFPSDPADQSLVIAATDAIVAAIAALNNLSIAQAQTAAAAALTAYDPPTEAEMNARTLAAASYATSAVLALVKARTDLIPNSPAAVSDIPTVVQIWTTALTEAYATDGAAFTGAQGLYMLFSALSQFEIVDDEIICRKIDGTTEAMRFLMDDPTNATSRTRTA